MKTITRYWPLWLAAAGGAAFLATAPPVGGQSGPAVGALLQAVQDQQKTLAANQTELETRLAKVAEELRVARIYVARGGRGKGVK